MKEWGESDDQPDRWMRIEFALLLLGMIIVLGSLAAPALSHGGGLAADGCHMDRSTGERHCHRGPKAGATSRPAANGGREVYYPNCAAARAAGAAPVRQGQPGYGSHLDRDGDGIGCE
jgi:hypothetical protein